MARSARTGEPVPVMTILNLPRLPKSLHLIYPHILSSLLLRLVGRCCWVGWSVGWLFSYRKKFMPQSHKISGLVRTLTSNSILWGGYNSLGPKFTVRLIEACPTWHKEMQDCIIDRSEQVEAYDWLKCSNARVSRLSLLPKILPPLPKTRCPPAPSPYPDRRSTTRMGASSDRLNTANPPKNILAGRQCSHDANTDKRHNKKHTRMTAGTTASAEGIRSYEDQPT